MIKIKMFHNPLNCIYLLRSFVRTPPQTVFKLRISIPISFFQLGDAVRGRLQNSSDHFKHLHKDVL